MLISSQLALVGRVDLVQASPDPVNTATIVYGEGAIATPRYRQWDGTGLVSEQTGPTMGATIRYAVLKSSPTRNEKMLVTSEEAGDVFASVSVFGVEWATAKTLGAAILVDAACRGFHVAYEQSSGDCMIVVRSLTDVKYWIWDGSSWTVDGTTLDLTVTTGDPVWIRLASDPLSDEIALIWIDDTYDVGGAIWSGSAWGDQLLLDGANVASEMIEEECIAVEYMAGNGKAMFAWGVDYQPTSADSGIGSTVWNGASWDSALTPVATGRAKYPPLWLSLKADPNSDELMLAVTDDDTDLNTVRWSGTAWDSAVEHSAGVRTETARCADVEWEDVSGHSGDAIVAWGIASDELTTRHWTGSAWDTAITTDPYAELTDQYIIQLRRNGDGKIFVSMVDSANGLHVWYWTSATGAWTCSGSGLGEIETSVSGGILYEPFEFAPDLVEPTPAIYVWPLSIKDTSLTAGKSFSVEVKVAGFTDVYGIAVWLVYKTSVLTATSIDETGNLFDDGGMPGGEYTVWLKFLNDTAGAGGAGKGVAKLELTEGFGEAYGVDGGGLVAKFTFTVDALGQSDLELMGPPPVGVPGPVATVEITDSWAIDIPHNEYNGYFENQVPVPEFPLGVAMEMALAVAIVYLWWKRRGKVKISRTHVSALR